VQDDLKTPLLRVKEKKIHKRPHPQLGDIPYSVFHNPRYRSSILVLTFMAYTCYHLSRKSISVVKNVLNQNCSSFTMPAGLNSSDIHWCDWAPFSK
ncbi:unnamed protein product, partial [Timema podura]|nr:unnamed protein product [Timema podura]